MQTKHYGPAVVVGLLMLMGSASGLMAETPDERAARIKAAQDALKQSQEDAESPEALKARVAELEAENRKLTAQLAKAIAALKAAGLAVGEDAAANDGRKVLRTFQQLVAEFPDPAKQRPEDRRKYEEIVLEWMTANSRKYRFENLRAKLLHQPKETMRNGEMGWYLLHVGYGQPESKKLGQGQFFPTSERFKHRGTDWAVAFYVLFRPKDVRQQRSIADLKRNDMVTISFQFVKSIDAEGNVYLPNSKDFLCSGLYEIISKQNTRIVKMTLKNHPKAEIVASDIR